jgi:hypothetical protein
LGCSVSHSRRKQKGRAYLEDALVAGKGLVKTGQMAPPLAQSSPPGKEERLQEKGKV